MFFYSYSSYPILGHHHLLGKQTNKQKNPASKQSLVSILYLLHSKLYIVARVIFQKYKSIHVSSPLPSPPNKSIGSSHLGLEGKSLTWPPQDLGNLSSAYIHSIIFPHSDPRAHHLGPWPVLLGFYLIIPVSRFFSLPHPFQLLKACSCDLCF